MFWHQSKAKHLNGLLLSTLGKYKLEGIVVFCLMKEFLSLMPPIQSVINLPRSIISALTWR
jgi:hypothetical protein